MIFLRNGNTELKIGKLPTLILKWKILKTMGQKNTVLFSIHFSLIAKTNTKFSTLLHVEVYQVNQPSLDCTCVFGLYELIDWKRSEAWSKQRL